MKLKDHQPKTDPNAVLVSWCPRRGAKCECPGLVGIRCLGPNGCGSVHDRVRERGDA